ncbi:AraC-like DNA-binding protein [Maribacter spongiicola]|uniref:AraC-like DNA-binding protein n=1 Tax=Maribacter spongiicola TaxID=1206753 RepID=A0A4R7K1A1_9FLAO|nr:helix-turn-helix domain-containing protein [Maribacter spongiicola]TDT43673.1 AraC-like DNA-binding protein [Maribacter spongiicola]
MSSRKVYGRFCEFGGSLKFFLIVILYLNIGVLFAQTSFVIDYVPENTKTTDFLYLSGSFNNWNPEDPNYRFTRNFDGTYELRDKLFKGSWISFKITRGSWDTVEVEKEGTPLTVRKHSFNLTTEEKIVIQVAGWADTLSLRDKQKKVTIVLTEVPRNTPPNSSFYVCGNFNGWVPGDSRYKMKQLVSGIYQVEVPIYSEQLEYKFTRGNWLTVEGKSYGRPIPNRILSNKEIAMNIPVKNSITYWEDQSYGIFNPYTLILILTALQGFFLIFIINSNSNNNKWANQALSVLIFIISITLIARVVIYDRVIYTDYPKLSLLTDFVFFLYGPVFLIYIERLLQHSKKSFLNYWTHFMPFFLQLVIYISFSFNPTHTFIEQNLFQSLESPPYAVYEIIVLIALVFNIYYWFRIKGNINKYFKNIEINYSTDQNIKYLNVIMMVLGVCLVIWTVIVLADVYSSFSDDPINYTTNLLIDIVWVVFSVMVYLLGYFAIKQPEIFRMSVVEIEDSKPEVNRAQIDTDELNKQKQALHKKMTQEQIYLNPDLSLPELALKMDTSVHALSKTINTGYSKNFRDFVNHYRIQDFIQRAQDEKYKNQTYLAIALAVGFNSKSSFNRSFKKVTDKSPRKYFDDLRES